MITHLFLLRLCWHLLSRGGPDWVCTTLGDMIPVLYLADNRNHVYRAWTTRWWVERIAKCGQNPSFEALIEKHPELLDSTLGVKEGWIEPGKVGVPING